MDTLTFNLDGAIVPKARARVTANGTYHPHNYQRWKRSAIALLRQQYKGKPLSSTASIAVELSGKHSRRGDADNIIGSCLDALVQAGVLEDDNLKRVPSIALALYWSKADPKTQITISFGGSS